MPFRYEFDATRDVNRWNISGVERITLRTDGMHGNFHVNLRNVGKTNSFTNAIQNAACSVRMCYCISGIRFSPRMEREVIYRLKKYDVKLYSERICTTSQALVATHSCRCACMGCSQNGKKDPEYRD
jgi:hypothetical protein